MAKMKNIELVLEMVNSNAGFSYHHEGNEIFFTGIGYSEIRVNRKEIEGLISDLKSILNKFDN